jgi:hypothetical protein
MLKSKKYCDKLYLRYKRVCDLVDTTLLRRDLTQMDYNSLLTLRSELEDTYRSAQRCGALRAQHREECISPERRDKGHKWQIDNAYNVRDQIAARLHEIHQHLLDMGVDEPEPVYETHPDFDPELVDYILSFWSEDIIHNNEDSKESLATLASLAARRLEDEYVDYHLNQYVEFGEGIKNELPKIVPRTLLRHNIKLNYTDKNEIMLLSNYILNDVAFDLFGRLVVDLDYNELEIIIFYLDGLSRQDFSTYVIAAAKKVKEFGFDSPLRHPERYGLFTTNDLSNALKLHVYVDIQDIHDWLTFIVPGNGIFTSVVQMVADEHKIQPEKVVVYAETGNIINRQIVGKTIEAVVSRYSDTFLFTLFEETNKTIVSRRGAIRSFIKHNSPRHRRSP